MAPTTIANYNVRQIQYSCLFVASANKLYVASRTTSLLQIFNTVDGSLLAQISVTAIYRLGYSPTANEVYASSQSLTTIARIDVATNLSLVAINIFAANADTFLELASDKMYISQTNSTGQVRIIDPSLGTYTGLVGGSISSFPSGMVKVDNPLSAHDGLVAVVVNNGIQLVDPAIGTVVATITNPSSSLNTTRDIAYSVSQDKYYIASQLANGHLVILEPDTATTFLHVTSLQNNTNISSVVVDDTNGFIFTACLTSINLPFLMLRTYDLVTLQPYGAQMLNPYGGANSRSGQISPDFANRDLYICGAGNIANNTVDRVRY